MSYLDLPRIHFQGRFSATPSTINNTIDNYNPALSSQQLNPGWNPTGLALFSLDCTVQGTVGPSGSFSTTSPLAGWRIGTPTQGTPAKIVDLDTDQQGLTELYGVTLELSPPSGTPLSARMGVPILTDLWFSRFPFLTSKYQLQDGAASGCFQTVLSLPPPLSDTNLPSLLNELLGRTARDNAGNYLLSIKLTFDLFDSNSTLSDGTTANPNFGFGRAVGTIGPVKQVAEGVLEPERFVLGRRFVASPHTGKNFWQGNFVVDAESRRLTLDLGGTVALNSDDQVHPTPTELPDDRHVISIVDSLSLKCKLGDRWKTVGTIDVSQDTYRKRAGVTDLLSSDPDILSNPLGLFAMDPNTGQEILVSAEHTDGLYTNVEKMSYRLSPAPVSIQETSGNVTHPSSADLVFWSLKFGQPFPTELRLELVPNPGLTGAPGQDASNTPPAGLDITQQVFSTAAVTNPALGLVKGRATTRIAARPVPPSELPADRQWLQSQVYLIGGAWQRTGATPTPSVQGGISVLVWADYKIPSNPTWKGNVGPILTQYATIYPGMKQILDIGDCATVVANAQNLINLMGRDPLDPAYMPVTRDLAPAKIATILQWLRNSPKCP